MDERGKTRPNQEGGLRARFLSVSEMEALAAHALAEDVLAAGDPSILERVSNPQVVELAKDIITTKEPPQLST